MAKITLRVNAIMLDKGTITTYEMLLYCLKSLFMMEILRFLPSADKDDVGAALELI